MFLAVRSLSAILVLGLIAPPPTPVRQGCDEGMWPFHHPPLEVLRQKYNFEPDRTWFDHLRLSTVHLQNGGSGAFVSADGLLLTNHHLVMSELQRASNQEQDLLEDGFLASRREAELKCKGLSLTILVESKDVTDTLRPAADPAAAERKLLAKARQESDPDTADGGGTRATGDTRDTRDGRRTAGSRARGGARGRDTRRARGAQEFRVQRLFGGEQFVLHRFRRYDDVRLVWAPEMNVGFFGGDADNFTYPRFCLDVALLRVYENDKPIHPKEYLSFSTQGAKVGELVLVSGHPAHTNRRQTVAQLLAARDVMYPMVISGLRTRRRALERYAKQGERQARAVRTSLWSIQNSLKLVENRLSALRNERLIDRKRKAEHALLQTVEGGKVRDAFVKVWETRKRYTESYVPAWLSRLPGGLATRCRAAAAAALLREQNPQAPCPTNIEGLAGIEVDKNLEMALLEATFQHALKALGRDHPVTKSMLEGRTPRTQAKRVVGGTRLHEPEFLRRAARARGFEGLRSLDDPMLNLHLRLEGIIAPHCDTMCNSRQLEREQLDRIERARYRARPGKVYPDADGTLRLSFGVVKGYTRDQRRVPAKTTIGGLLDRCDSFDRREPYDLPARFLTQRDKLLASTPLNFVCTADIAAGNSGSPVVNRENEVVGVVFDGNLESLGNSFVYDQEQARAVCVHSTAILEILEKVYAARHLVQEIRRSKR